MHPGPRALLPRAHLERSRRARAAEARPQASSLPSCRCSWPSGIGHRVDGCPSGWPWTVWHAAAPSVRLRRASHLRVCSLRPRRATAKMAVVKTCGEGCAGGAGGGEGMWARPRLRVGAWARSAGRGARGRGVPRLPPYRGDPTARVEVVLTLWAGERLVPSSGRPWRRWSYCYY